MFLSFDQDSGNIDFKKWSKPSAKNIQFIVKISNRQFVDTSRAPNNLDLVEFCRIPLDKSI